jgi:ferric-dicitrate binding protein FerR (iron transport regulator)
MDTEAIYEKWRRNRSRAEPAADFAARVMRSVKLLPAPHGPSPGRRRSQQLLRIGVCAAAVLAALFRVVELFNLFSTGSLEN